jgi:hypothetical protein
MAEASVRMMGGVDLFDSQHGQRFMSLHHLPLLSEAMMEQTSAAPD